MVESTVDLTVLVTTDGDWPFLVTVMVKVLDVTTRVTVVRVTSSTDEQSSPSSSSSSPPGAPVAAADLEPVSALVVAPGRVLVLVLVRVTPVRLPLLIWEAMDLETLEMAVTGQTISVKTTVLVTKMVERESGGRLLNAFVLLGQSGTVDLHEMRVLVSVVAIVRVVSPAGEPVPRGIEMLPVMRAPTLPLVGDVDVDSTLPPFWPFFSSTVSLARR